MGSGGQKLSCVELVHCVTIDDDNVEIQETVKVKSEWQEIQAELEKSKAAATKVVYYPNRNYAQQENLFKLDDKTSKKVKDIVAKHDTAELTDIQAEQALCDLGITPDYALRLLYRKEDSYGGTPYGGYGYGYGYQSKIPT